MANTAKIQINELASAESVEPVKALKRTRQSYDSQLTAEQKAVLHTHYQKTRYPSHTEKKQLAEKYNIDPFLLNKWFAKQRICNKETKSPAQKKRKPPSNTSKS